MAPTPYHRLTLDDKLALLSLLERETATAASPREVLLAADGVLRGLDVLATVDQVGQRLRSVHGCSISQLLQALYEMGDDGALTHLCRPAY